MKNILLLLGLVAGVARTSAELVYYDIANSQLQNSLSPHYVGTSQTAISASALTVTEHLRSPTKFVDSTETGNFIFTDWDPYWWDPVPGYIEFNLTAKAPLTLNNMSYTFFTGIYNYRVGPHYLTVLASTNGFASSITIGSHLLGESWPGLYCPNNYTENLSGLGTIESNAAVSIRFYASSADYDVPAGLWNKSPGNNNLTVDFSIIPEPATALSLVLGGLIITGYRRMRKAYGHF